MTGTIHDAIFCLQATDDIESCLDYEAVKYKLEQINNLINIFIEKENKIKSLLEYKSKNENILKNLMNEKQKLNCKLEEKIPVYDYEKTTSPDFEKKTKKASDSIHRLRDSQNPKDNKLYKQLETLYTDLKEAFETYDAEQDNKEKNKIYFQEIISKFAEYEIILEDIENYGHPGCLTFGGKKKKGRKTNKRRTKRNQKASKRTKKMKKSKKVKSKTKKVKK